MTRLHNPNFISFDGESITGRVPPRIEIFGTATKEQLSALSHEYKLFYDCVNTMIGTFLSRERILSDGSRVRLISNNGLDWVQFWPTGDEGKSLNPDGYLTTPIDIDHTFGWNKDINNNDISPEAHISALKVFRTPPPITLHSKYQAGPVSWICSDGSALTYDHGGTNRYATNLWDVALSSTFYTTGKSATNAVYYRGTTIRTPSGVHGAAIFDKWLLILTDLNAYYCISPLAGINDALRQGIFRREINPTWSTVPIINAAPATPVLRVSSWHFKPDGSRAAVAVMFPASLYDNSAPATYWNLEKAYRVAVPQAKWYLDFTAEGSGTTAHPQASWAQEAFTTQAIGPKVNGVAPGYFVPEEDLSPSLNYKRDAWRDAFIVGVHTPSGGGTITYTGRRLMGIDYDEDGNELVISMNITGSGTCSAGETSGSMSLSMQWDFSINDVQLFSVPTTITTLTYSGTPTVVVSGGGISCQYVTLYDIDARYKSYVLERLTRTAAAVDVRGDATCVVEHAFNGAVVFTEPVTFPTQCAPTARFSSANGRRFEYVLNNGFIWKQDNDYLVASIGGAPVLPFPTLQGRGGENYYCHDNYQTYWSIAVPNFNMGQIEHLAGYPNQVLDALYSGTGGPFYSSVGSGVIQYLAFQFGSDVSSIIIAPITDWSSVSSTFVDLPSYPLLYPNMMLDATPEGDGVGQFSRPYRYVQGIARKNYDIDHHVIATKNTASRSFYNVFMRCIQLKAGPSPVETPIPPFVTCDAFIRPPIDTGNPEAPRVFVRYDLMPLMEAKINNEQAPATVDTPSFRIDPIRVI